MTSLQKWQSLPSRVIRSAADYNRKLVTSLRMKAPRLFGMAIQARLLQLYKEDADHSTWIDLSNYMSYFAAYPEVRIDFKVTAYDRAGKRLGAGGVSMDAFQSKKLPLASLLSGLDEYGIFTVDAKYQVRNLEKVLFLEETSPQFMTCFVPKRMGSSMQMIHSHKVLDDAASVRMPFSRVSKVTEDLSAIAEIDVYVLNSSPQKLGGRIGLEDFDGKEVLAAEVSVPPRGVQRIAFPIGDAAPSPYVYHRTSLSRLNNHRKPIIFRRFRDGSITANHS